MTLFEAIERHRKLHSTSTCFMCGRQGTQSVEIGEPYKDGDIFKADVVRTCAKCKNVARACLEGTA